MSVVASLPLVAGGETEAKRKEYRSAATSYALQRDDVARQLVQGLLTSAIDLHTNYTTINIDARAAVAAENNLRLLTAQYTRGTISIIDLLDAQTQFIKTQESAQSSKLEFLAKYTQWIRYLNLLESINSDNIFEKLNRIIGE